MYPFVEEMSEQELKDYISELLNEYEKRFKKLYKGAYVDYEKWIKTYLNNTAKSPFWKLSPRRLTSMLRRLLGIYLNTGNEQAKQYIDNIVKELRLRDFYDLSRQCQFKTPGNACILWGGDIRCREENCPIKREVIKNVRVEV